MWRPHAFNWRGTNYLLKLSSDCTALQLLPTGDSDAVQAAMIELLAAHMVKPVAVEARLQALLLQEARAHGRKQKFIPFLRWEPP
jgi:hypothetical protein